MVVVVKQHLSLGKFVICFYYKKRLTKQKDQGDSQECRRFGFAAMYSQVCYDQVQLGVIPSNPFLAWLGTVEEVQLRSHHSHVPADQKFTKWKYNN